MRVLITSVIGENGATTHVWDLVRCLGHFGVDVSVAIYRTRRGKRESLLRKTSELGVPAIVYRSANRLIEFARMMRSTLIHAQSSSTFASALAASRVIDAPLVITAHSAAHWSKLKRRAIAVAAHIVAVGLAQAESVGKQHNHKVSIIHNGVDVTKFVPDPGEDGSEGTLRVVWFGRVNGSLTRGVRSLDRAVGLLRENGREIEATMIGRATGFSPRHMRDLGWQSDPLPFLQQAHIVFGHGRSLREGMATGGVGFLIGHGYGGLMTQDRFEQGNLDLGALPQYTYPDPTSSVIAQELSHLYDDRKHLDALRRESRVIAERFFDVRDMVNSIRAVYLRAVQSKWEPFVT